MIPPKQVQEILDATRIEEVVEEFVTLKRRGVNLIGLCPFHGEKTPSFNVNPARNIFVCFGCGKKGDAITFLRRQAPSPSSSHPQSGQETTQPLSFLPLAFDDAAQDSRILD